MRTSADMYRFGGATAEDENAIRIRSVVPDIAVAPVARRLSSGIPESSSVLSSQRHRPTPAKIRLCSDLGVVGGRNALRHDHAPGVEHDLAHLGQVDRVG